jgi:hypothetical protein
MVLQSRRTFAPKRVGSGIDDALFGAREDLDGARELQDARLIKDLSAGIEGGRYPTKGRRYIEKG